MIVSLTGDDIIDLGAACDLTTLVDCLADGNWGELTVPNDLMNMTIGKNGNAIYAKDENGRRFELTLRVLKGSEADKKLISYYKPFVTKIADKKLITGYVQKQLGDGEGNLQNYRYSLAGGFIKRAPNFSSNSNGDTEQSVTVFEIAGVITDITIG